MNKKNIENYIFSLKNLNGGFYLQKNFNQTTLMSSAFSIITLELVDSLNKIEISKEQNYFLKYQDKKTGFFVDPNLNLDYLSLIHI